MIELRRLRYLVAVADAGHVTRAAETLGIQQPPLTRAIQGLEAELGVKLFHRRPTGMVPTEAGAALVKEARAVLEQAARLPEVARRVARGEQGDFAIGYTSSAAFHPLVTRQIRAFGRQFQRVRLVLEEDSSLALIEGLRANRLDAAFLRSTAGAVDDLNLTPLGDEPMVAVVPTGRRWPAEIALADLAGETFVLYRRPAGPGLYDAIIAACQRAGFSPSVGQEAPRLPSTLSLVAAGLGVSIVPASMRRMNLEGVAYLRITGAPDLVAPLVLASHRHRPASALLARFRQAVSRGA